MADTKLHPKLIEESKKTIKDAINKLEQYGKVFVCRPTGFGKTYMLTRIAKYYKNKYPDKKIAYIYPLDIIPFEVKQSYGTKKESDREIREIINKYTDFISYSKLTRDYTTYGPDYWADEFEKYSIILLDEVHAAGSEGFKNIYDGLKHKIGKDGIKLVGVTATPNRMDDTLEFSVLEGIFDNIQVYEYTLGHCIKDGIIKKMVIANRNYNLADLAEQLKEVMKGKCKQKNLNFDEKSFNVELGKIIKDTGTEASMIYKYLPKAGYNLADPDTKYFKFIVFFTNIQDVADRGPEVEEWFNQAFNEVAKKDLNLKKEFIIQSHYLTSSDTSNGDIERLVKEKKTRFKYNNTQKLSNISSEKYVVDLILTVNMTNMGYHDKDITGIVMLRGTKSEIIYYQQLGRTISVTSEYSPLIYDFVNNVNTKFWSKKDRQREVAKLFIEGGDDNTREKSNIDYSDIIAVVEGDEDAGEQFLNRWSDVLYSQKSMLKYLYEDRNAPIVAISADTGLACKYIAEQLIDAGVKLREEDDMYAYEFKIANSNMKTKDDKDNANTVIKHLNSKQASDYYENIRNTPQTLYNYIQKLIGGKK